MKKYLFKHVETFMVHLKGKVKIGDLRTPTHDTMMNVNVFKTKSDLEKNLNPIYFWNKIKEKRFPTEEEMFKMIERLAVMCKTSVKIFRRPKWPEVKPRKVNG